METLLSLVIIAALFFLMMRFGCGSHMMRGGRGKDANASGGAHGGCCGDGMARHVEAAKERDPA